MAAPSSLGIVGYHTLLGTQPPENRLSLIQHLSKDILLLEIAGLNYRLSGGVTIEMKTSTKHQQAELFWFCGKDPNLYNHYASKISNLKGREHVNLFSRRQCAFALEEILQSDLPVINGFSMEWPNTWESLFLYLLSVNTEITKMTRTEGGEPVNFETLSSKMLPLNEAMIFNDPIFLINRGHELLQYLANDAEVGQHLLYYLQSTYKLSPEEFIFQIYSLLMANQSEAEHLNFHYQVPQNHPAKYLFEILSGKFVNADFKTLLNIRKNPFYKRSDNRFILLDQQYLVEKSYYQAINDFYFDYLKATLKQNGKHFTMQDYKSIIGRFFEKYVDQILRSGVKANSNTVIKTLDELKIFVKKQPFELCDIYLRDHRKIMIGEIKSTTIYDEEKYSGNVNALYKNDRNRFFKDFGVDQLVRGIQALADKLKEIDRDLQNVKRPAVYPVIFMNDKAFQTPLMVSIFNDRFKELLQKIDTTMFHVFPLTIVHISELEQMQKVLAKDISNLWRLLEANFRQKDNIIPPFYITLFQQGINYPYEIVTARLYSMLDKFGSAII